MNNEDKKGRRKCERRHFREDILIDEVIACASSDISENGLYVCMMQPLEDNRIISVTIPFKGAKIIVKGQVRYSHPGIGMGVVFIDLNDEQRSMIRELVKSPEEYPD
jgi:hypothetical protein